MKHKLTITLLLVVLVALFASSCGTTTFRRRAYTSRKYIGYKTHWNWWHAHHYRPHAHARGTW